LLAIRHAEYDFLGRSCPTAADRSRFDQEYDLAEDRKSTSEEGIELGVLDEVSTSTTAIDLGATAQISVILPVGYREEDRDDDDDVLADELSADEIARQELDSDDETIDTDDAVDPDDALDTDDAVDDEPEGSEGEEHDTLDETSASDEAVDEDDSDEEILDEDSQADDEADDEDESADDDTLPADEAEPAEEAEPESSDDDELIDDAELLEEAVALDEQDDVDAEDASEADMHEFADQIDELMATATNTVSLDDSETDPSTRILREATTTKEPLVVKEHSPILAAVSEETAARVQEAARTGRQSFIKSHARRLGEAESSAAREESAVLTDARLLETGAIRKPVPTDPWRRVIHSMTGGVINFGNSKATRRRAEVKARIGARIDGQARFVPVMSRKGGVGKTTVTALLGMALADARDDRVVAVDANPDRGTLAERIAKPSGKTVRDLVRDTEQIRGYGDMSAHVTRDSTRLDVLASDADPHVADAFSDDDYRAVADIAQHYYSLVLTDTGTGIVHSVMSATLDLADQLVIVSGVSIDEARLASETLTWLEANGREELAQNAIVVINQEAAGKTHVRIDEVESHFRTRVRDVVRIPFDPAIATGSAITFHELAQPTRDAARSLAALVVEGIRA